MRACRSTRGTIALVGFVTGTQLSLDIVAVQAKRVTIAPVTNGSVQDMKQFAAAVSAARLVPVIDRTFAFAEIPQAYKHLEAAAHFGKVVIDLRA